jgi:hypothetical protein
MTQWQLIADDGPWWRLVRDQQVVATGLRDGPVAELASHLSPGDAVDVAPELEGDQENVPRTPKPHRCEGPELWTGRMQFALLSGDMPAYDFVVTQVGDCARCWRAVAHWTLNLLAGNRAVAAGGTDAAAGHVLKEIARLTGP